MQIRCPHCERELQLVGATPPEEISCPKCGSRFSLHDTIEETKTLEELAGVVGRFELVERLGAGSYGVVWLAMDTQLNREVAVKIPHRQTLTPADAAFIFREARAAAHLQHESIVRVYEVGRQEDRVFIVSEYIDGVRLAEWADTYKPSFKDATAICAKIARALHHAHERGIIHRDLKPSNVLVDAQAVPHLTDFGLAKHEGIEATIAIEGRALGTPAYMSPEQARGEGHTAGPATDIYSLGVILYELLARRRPFVGGKKLLEHQIVHDDVESPRKHNRHIPEDLARVCLKALQRSEDRRYATALEFAEDLERFVRGESVQARAIGIWERTRRWIVRYPARAISVALLAVAIVLGSSLAYALLVPPPGAIGVQVETSPPGARLVIIPLDARNNKPLVEQAIRPWRKTPARVALLPGDYLCVASVDDQTFHEVYRRVPDEANAKVGLYPHLRWTKSDTELRWPAITLHKTSDVNRGMTVIHGGQTQLTAPPAADTTFVADFYADVTPVTYEQLRAYKLRAPFLTDPNDPRFGRAVVRLSWDEAIYYAEALGKCLPTRAQFELLWNARSAANISFTTSGEWTFDVPIGPAANPAYRVVAGLDDDLRFVEARVRAQVDPNISFRCVRSVKPRYR